jgi:hypothetical protein
MHHQLKSIPINRSHSSQSNVILAPPYSLTKKGALHARTKTKEFGQTLCIDSPAMVRWVSLAGCRAVAAKGLRCRIAVRDW